jgi:hypothetical protein
MMREEKINRRWRILGQGGHISKKKLYKNHVVWSMVQIRFTLHTKPVQFPGSHPKSGLPWSSTCHGSTALV